MNSESRQQAKRVCLRPPSQQWPNSPHDVETKPPDRVFSAIVSPFNQDELLPPPPRLEPLRNFHQPMHTAQAHVIPVTEVCYGSIRRKGPPEEIRFRSSLKLCCRLDGLVFQDGHESLGWKLDDDDFKLLSLFRNEGIEVELMWISAMIGNDKVKEGMWWTLYGDKCLANELGSTLQDLDIYLQEPIAADKDVLYWNPHKFQNKPGLRTSEIQSQWAQEQIDIEALVLPDILATFTSEDALPETEGSWLLKTPLKDHQKRALTFMLRREQGWNLNRGENDVWSANVNVTGAKIFINNIDNSLHDNPPPQFKGGIIADEMGLGKTLTMLSLISHDRTDLNRANPKASTLIIVPPSLLSNWKAEIELHIRTEHLSLHYHHGPQRHAQASRFDCHDFVLITYTTLVQEWRDKGRQSMIFEYPWHRVVLDEAHCIKEPTTLTAKACCALNADRRWVITGTPIQNRLSDLLSLFRFLRIHPYSNEVDFYNHIIDPWIKGYGEEAVERLKKLLRFTMLRRPSTTVTLPPREDCFVSVNFDAEETRNYIHAKERAVNYFNNILASGQSSSGYMNALEKINALRMICNLGSEYLRKEAPTANQYADQLPRPPMASDSDSISRALKLSDNVDTPATRASCVDLMLGSETSASEASTPEPTPNGAICHAYSTDTSTLNSTSLDDELDMRQASELRPSQYPSKVRALLKDLTKQPHGTKSVMFSSWRSTFDVIKMALEKSGIQCLQVDGKTPMKQRAHIFSEFSQSSTYTVLLLSLSCGAVGLTLTAASRAYLFEPQWNPAIEEQALSRIYRLGQTKKVTTIRFTVKDSIEKYVLDVQNNKRALQSLLFSFDVTQTPLTSREKIQELRNLLS